MPLKTLLLCFLLTHCLSGYAQTSPVLLRRIQAATQLPRWATRVKQNEQRVAQLKSNPRNSFQLMQPEDLSSAADTQYARKLARLQQMLNKNQYLRAYTLQAPVKMDLISLTQARLQTLSDFLAGLPTKVTILLWYLRRYIPSEVSVGDKEDVLVWQRLNDFDSI